MPWVTLRTGTYKLNERISFHISGNADGVGLVLHDLERGMNYCASVLDGQVQFAEVSHNCQPVGGTAAEPATVGGRYDAEPRPTMYLPATDIEFTVVFPATPLPPRVMRVLGGYESRGEVVVLYRQTLANTFFDLQGLLSGQQIRLNLGGNRCILKSDRGKFHELAPGAQFKIGRRTWRKLSRAKLRAMTAGKTFEGQL